MANAVATASKEFNGINVTRASFPAAESVKAPSEWRPMVEDMIKNGGVSVAMPYKSEADKAAVTKFVQNVQRAGRELNVTVRKRIVADKNTCTVYLETREAIKRTRKAPESE